VGREIVGCIQSASSVDHRGQQLPAFLPRAVTRCRVEVPSIAHVHESGAPIPRKLLRSEKGAGRVVAASNDQAWKWKGEIAHWPEAAYGRGRIRLLGIRRRNQEGARHAALARLRPTLHGRDAAAMRDKNYDCRGTLHAGLQLCRPCSRIRAVPIRLLNPDDPRVVALPQAHPVARSRSGPSRYVQEGQRPPAALRLHQISAVSGTANPCGRSVRVR